MHLAARQEHAEKCTGHRCAPDCGHHRFHAWLDGPLLPSDLRSDARIEGRRAALLRGDIPA